MDVRVSEGGWPEIAIFGKPSKWPARARLSLRAAKPPPGRPGQEPLPNAVDRKPRGSLALLPRFTSPNPTLP